MVPLRKVSGKKSRIVSLIEDGRKSHSSRLVLCGLDLKEFPISILSCPFPNCLEVLDLSNNGLRVLDQTVHKLENLRELILSGNELKTLPREIGFLRKLVVLDLSRNKLEFLPRSINYMKNLETVNLSGNDLVVIPDFLLSLPKLCKVFCIRNPRLENIPKDVAADGLDAMRKYLNIIVEVYENDFECRYRQERRRGCILSEIEQNWALQDEQLVRRTKDASTQLFDNDSINSSGNGKQGMNQREVSISTQTDLNDNCSGILPQTHQPIFDRFSGKMFDLGIRERSNESDIDPAIAKLAEIFHHQINLINKYRTSSPETRRKKSLAVDSVFDDCLSKSSKTKQLCHSCGLTRKPLTSEYGSMSSCSHLCDDIIITDKGSDGSCDGNDGSCHDDISETDISYLLDECSLEDLDDDIWHSEEEHRFINACKELVIRQNGVEIKIPELNVSGHCQEEFEFQVVNSFCFSPIMEDNMLLASPIVCVAPHGAKFYSSMEAIVKLPLNIVVEDGITVKCYESNTDKDEMPSWQEIRPERFEVLCGSVIIKTMHFSLFCAAALRTYTRVEKRVSAADGGVLVLHESKDSSQACKVHFPKKSLHHDKVVSLTVLFSDEKYGTKDTSLARASPILALEPSGIHFQEDVTITLPLPDAKAVYEENNDPKLIVLESQTCINEKPVWKELKTQYWINNTNGIYSLSFKVKHFTLFQTVWEGLVSTLDTVKRVAQTFVPQFTQRVIFQALMSECHHKQQFGLCVFCYLVGNPPVTECSQFPVEVGRSKPKDLRKGDVFIELKSKKFTPDLDVGESGNGMTKTEKFCGLEFDKQFALKFIEPVKEGIFGMVIVKQKENTNQDTLIVELLLQKTNSKRLQPTRKPTVLETALAQDLAASLSIEERWKELAITLGYTRNEINMKFSNDKPIEQILTDFMSRGGDDKDFVRAMYEVGRRFKLIPYDQILENRENRRLENRIQAHTSSEYCNCPSSPEKTPLKSAKRKMAERDYEEEEILSDGKLDRIAGSIAEKWKHVGRALGIEQIKISEIDLNNRYEGGREKAFQMLAVWKELYPGRCSASVLKKVLAECGLNHTARRLFIH